MRISAILVLYSGSECSHISASTMSKLWVAAGCGDKGGVSMGFEWLAQRMVIEGESEGLRSQFRQVFARNTDLNGVVF